MTASVDDVATQLGRPITDPGETKQVEAWIDLAEAKIRKRYPTLDQQVESGSIASKNVDLVEALAVSRYARNPDGHTSDTTRIDDYQRTVSTNNAASTLVILDEEWDLIAPVGTGADGAFTIAPSGW